jgi:hypothetical protein
MEKRNDNIINGIKYKGMTDFLYELNRYGYKDDTIKTTESVLNDIKELVSSKGYIYVLCMILFEDFHLNVYHYVTVWNIEV